MQPLRRFLDRLRPPFEKGGRFEKLYPLYEAIDTFLYTPGSITRGMAHIRDGMDLKRMMATVVVALVPCVFVACYNVGLQAHTAMAQAAANGAAEAAQATSWQAGLARSLGAGTNPASFLDNFIYGAAFFFPVYFVTVAVGGLWEALFASVRGHEITEGFLVTSLLFPLTLPPTIPLWQVALGISFGVVFGKEIYGGVGKNFLNPALTARAFLYFAYPAQITGDAIWTAVDGYTAATPLGAVATADPKASWAAIENSLNTTWWDAFLGGMQGSMGETSTLACLIGAAILIATGVGSWRIMLAVVIGAVSLSTVLWGASSQTNAMFLMPPWWHLVIGGFAFGTVFMATDPVSASMTETGKWFYGFLIGAMTILIRVVNPAFPEGIMLAILFGNVFAPLIDYFVIQANIRRRVARNAA